MDYNDDLSNALWNREPRRYEGPLDVSLWTECQLIVYPDRCPSIYPPFHEDCSSPSRKPASWLYHTLAADPQLRAQVLS